MTRNYLAIVMAAVLALAVPAGAADKLAGMSGMSGMADESFASAKSAEIEIMRVRMGTNPSPSAMSALMDAENALRQFRQAPAGKKDATRSQLEAAMANLDLEISAQPPNY